MSEFDLINRFFKQKFPTRKDVILGIGDDAALCTAPAGMQLVMAMDTLVEGVHFPIDTKPEDIAYKALAVNLSDLAAMGATPAWMTLALTCPKVDESWLARFSQGLLDLATAADISLIGGDTTRGSLTITIQVTGFVELALLRSAAKVGDGIYVTGTLGDAGLGLAAVEKRIKLAPEMQNYAESRLNKPTARLKESQNLIGIANACIDVSDGLVADLNHILTASKVGASLNVETLPLSKALQSINRATALELALTAGDDYELCFTMPDHKKLSIAATRIGTIEEQLGLRCGKAFSGKISGYQHF
ncbi:thiamine-phosphate kinase [Candidatus Marithrix sp. Canyon 246]|uniref:thiamine-phosphate kinase n=1 Tax=Candidatus Marithrix sp. Canyon 246 TaxID=1827136 RepID=UPI00084A23E1|nr:thiamine-phosphate kinase [Candidatus Marithrix sp. Canyon 246]